MTVVDIVLWLVATYLGLGIFIIILVCAVIGIAFIRDMIEKIRGW